MKQQEFMYSGLGERLKKEWKIYLAALIFIIIADSIGQIKIPLGPGTLILFPIFYSIFLGILSGPQILKIFKKPEVKAASKLVIVCICPFIAKLGINAGASIETVISAGPALLLQEFGNLGTAIITAIFLIFVVMAAQFESPKFSLMVMTTIPFSLIGSFGLLYLADCPISMVSLLGFLMLVGTVVNNGILYVDTVNQYRSEMDRDTALIEAGATRLRPILMTTLTTVVSMIPMALAYGDSGKSMQGLALVDVGGLVASTILALLMLPIYYEVMSPKRKPEPHYD